MTNYYSFVRRLMFALALLSSVALAQVARAELTIGTVDVNRVFKEYRKTKESERKLDAAKDAAKKEFDERADAYKKELEAINKLNAQLDAPILAAAAKTQKTKERDEKIETIKGMEREMSEFRQTREHQLQQLMQNLHENIIKDITAVVLDQAKARKFDLVFDTSGASLNRFSTVLFSKESADFTADVVAALNKAPAATATPTPKPPSSTKP